jgi:hypothetical protein
VIMSTATTPTPPEPAYVTDCRAACTREVVLTGLDESARRHAEEARRNDSEEKRP